MLPWKAKRQPEAGAEKTCTLYLGLLLLQIQPIVKQKKGSLEEGKWRI